MSDLLRYAIMVESLGVITGWLIGGIWIYRRIDADMSDCNLVVRLMLLLSWPVVVRRRFKGYREPEE